MNAPKAYYEGNMRAAFEPIENGYKHLLRGTVETYSACDTLQVTDYSKYDMAMFDPAHKAQVHQTQFPLDLKNVFELGQKLAS